MVSYRPRTYAYFILLSILNSLGVSVTRFPKLLLTLSIGSAFALPAAVAQTSLTPASAVLSKASAGVTVADSTFVKKAASGGIAEVELGQLALQKASSPDVKQFAQRMVNDHTKANGQLKQVAADEHIRLPQSMSAKDKATKDTLANLSGDDFDRAYMKDMVQDHRHDVAEFERESKSAQDPAVKSFAMQTLPTLRDHLKEAQRIAPKEQSAQNSPR
jgi:putative membrane protein